MAIDPERLQSQRLAVVGEKTEDGWPEHKCPRCGGRTRSRPGAACRRCVAGDGIRDLHLVSTDRLLLMRGQIETELKRRRDELDAALREAP